ncbi:MAG: hypothetical protein HYY59_07390 [Candidatus Omnitrophica bacterium]|nr:hypothetical protein [Candidatus Omnitrophota bacterium]
MAESDNARVLIVGCGELGSRHLQAVATLPDVAEIDVVDSRTEALRQGQERLVEVTERNPQTRYRWLSSLEEAAGGGQLCIVATQAEGRCQLVRDVVERLGYGGFLLEKIVGQSIEEIEGLETFLGVRGCTAWVNLKTRTYPIYQHIKQRLEPGEPIQLTSLGGNHGLATNGVHTADLFAFFDGTEEIELVGCRVDPILHPSKRGERLFDLSGTLQGATKNGSHFMLSYAKDHKQSEQITIAGRRYRCIVDQSERKRWVVESHVDTGWVWQPVPSTENLRVSLMSRQFVREILHTGTCSLPTLKESLVAHRFIFGAIQPVFSQLMGHEVELCPVT